MVCLNQKSNSVHFSVKVLIHWEVRMRMSCFRSYGTWTAGRTSRCEGSLWNPVPFPCTTQQVNCVLKKKSFCIVSVLLSLSELIVCLSFFALCSTHFILASRGPVVRDRLPRLGCRWGPLTGARAKNGQFPPAPTHPGDCVDFFPRMVEGLGTLLAQPECCISWRDPYSVLWPQGWI